MTLKLNSMLCVTMVLAGPALADDRLDLAQQYTQLPGVQSMIDDMFSPETMSAQVRATLPPGLNLSEGKMARIGQLLSREMNKIRPDLEAIMTTTSAEQFTAEELEALIAFYSTEHGASVMSKMPAMMQNVMAQLAPQMQIMQQNTAGEIAAIMQGE